MSRTTGRITVLALATLLVAACGRKTSPTFTLPDLQNAAERARAELEGAYEAVQAEPTAAHRWVRLAVLLIEHEFDTAAAEAYAVARFLDPDNYLWPFAYGARVAVNDPAAALPLLETAREQRPGDLYAQLALARTFDRIGDAAAAEATLRYAISLDETDPDARAAVARLLMERQALAEARVELEYAVARNRTSRIVLNTLAELEQREGNTDAAATLAARADAALPAHDAYDLPLLAAQANPPGGQVILARARVMLQNGRGPQAEGMLRELIALNPDNPYAHMALGQFFVDAGRGTEGLVALYAATGVAPEQSDTALALADGLRMVNRIPEAAAAYEALLQQHPKMNAARRGLAACDARMGRTDDAVASFETIIADDPDDADARIALATIEMGRGGFPAAINALEPMIAIEAGEPPSGAQVRAMSMMGQAALQAGRPADAVAVLRRAVAAAPGSLENTRLLATALARAGQGREAAAVLRDALARSPREPTLLFELTLLLATSPDADVRNGDEAVGLAETLVLAPGAPGARHPATLDVLACAYAEAGRFADAVATGEQALYLARQGGTPPMIAAIERRLELFRGGMAYHEEPGRQ